MFAGNGKTNLDNLISWFHHKINILTSRVYTDLIMMYSLVDDNLYVAECWLSVVHNQLHGHNCLIILYHIDNNLQPSNAIL